MADPQTVSVAMRQVVIYPDREDGGWVAEAPSLPGCVTQEATRSEVLMNARDSIQTWIDGAGQVGMPLSEECGDGNVESDFD